MDRQRLQCGTKLMPPKENINVPPIQEQYSYCNQCRNGFTRSPEWVLLLVLLSWGGCGIVFLIVFLASKFL